MRSKAIVVVLALSTALGVFSQTPAKKKSTAKASTAASKTSPKQAASGKKSAAAKKASSKKTPAKQTARYRRSTQREPAPERYQEIQQSLADKGYFAGPVNGAWGPDSVAALKRFQRDQNIGDDGKLGALSLIALGLGPQRRPSGPGGGGGGPVP